VTEQALFRARGWRLRWFDAVDDATSSDVEAGTLR